MGRDKASGLGIYLFISLIRGLPKKNEVALIKVLCFLVTEGGSRVLLCCANYREGDPVGVGGGIKTLSGYLGN